jgi:hypothetical protein
MYQGADSYADKSRCRIGSSQHEALYWEKARTINQNVA